MIRHNEKLVADIEITTRAIKDYSLNEEDGLRDKSEACTETKEQTQKEVAVAALLHKVASYKKEIAI